jgi:hypothetical protein
MIPFALLCLLLSSATTELVNEVYRVPADEWRYVEIGLKQQPALLAADVEAVEGDREIRLALVRSEDLDRGRNGRPHGALALTEPGHTAHLRYFVRAPGVYAVVVENRDAEREASVRMRVWLDFGAGRGMEVTQLSPHRRSIVVLISCASFIGIVAWSARRLLKGMRRDADSRREDSAESQL